MVNIISKINKLLIKNFVVFSSITNVPSDDENFLNQYVKYYQSDTSLFSAIKNTDSQLFDMTKLFGPNFQSNFEIFKSITINYFSICFVYTIYLIFKDSYQALIEYKKNPDTFNNFKRKKFFRKNIENEFEAAQIGSYENLPRNIYESSPWLIFFYQLIFQITSEIVPHLVVIFASLFNNNLLNKNNIIKNNQKNENNDENNNKNNN